MPAAAHNQPNVNEFAPSSGIKGKLTDGWTATTSTVRSHNPLHRGSSTDKAPAAPSTSRASGRPDVDQFAPASGRGGAQCWMRLRSVQTCARVLCMIGSAGG